MTALPRTRRPRSEYIEYLEKRIAPATFIVNNLNDAGPGSLREAVLDANASPGADTILFKGDATDGQIRLTTGEIAITDSGNIKGPGASKLTINAQNLSRILDINDGTAAVKNVTISGLSMVEGNSGGGSFGGGIRSLESLTLVKSVISGCQASGPAGYGGGLYAITDGKIVIRSCKIIGNTAAGCGGGLSVVADRGIQIINTVVSGNTAARCGGGIYATILDGGSTGDILISGSVITDNTAARGGGINADNNRIVGGVNVGKITVRDTLISSNSASLSAVGLATEGGGLFFDSGRVLIGRCMVTSNNASDVGGGLSTINVESLAIKASQIINNHTTSSTGIGGGAYIASAGKSILIQSTLISSNVSSGDGGGVFSINNRLAVQKSTISGNTTADAGGGIYAKQGTLNINRSTIRDNQAGGPGGGVSTVGTEADRVDLRITNSIFTTNRAASGGGVDTNGDGSVTIAASRIIQNTASAGDGGGAYLRTGSGVIAIMGSLFNQNTGASDGGGLALNGGTVPITIKDTMIVDNYAPNKDGGGIAIFDGVLNLVSSTISNNIANEQGGGMWVDRTASFNLSGSKVTGNIAPSGPQIYRVPSS